MIAFVQYNISPEAESILAAGGRVIGTPRGHLLCSVCYGLYGMCISLNNGIFQTLFVLYFVTSMSKHQSQCYLNSNKFRKAIVIKYVLQRNLCLNLGQHKYLVIICNMKL